MVLQLGVSMWFKVWIVICLLQLLVNIIMCHKSFFRLPALPATDYTLDDVIILPENKDFVETEILTTETETVLATVNVTIESDFRLGDISVIHNASIESGLQMVTKTKASVVIQLRTGLLHLPSIQQYANECHLFTLRNTIEVNTEHILFVQPIHPNPINTSMTMCTFEADETDPPEIPLKNECKKKNISTSSSFLQVNASTLHRIKIISEQPFSILEGRRTHRSSLGSNGQDFNSPKYPDLQIIWHKIPPKQERSNYYVLIPSENTREVILWVMSSENTTVYFETDEDIMPLTLSANIPRNISMSVDQGTTLLVSSEDVVFIRFQDAQAPDCTGELIAINVAEQNFAGDIDMTSVQINYKWSYSLSDTLIIICPLIVEISVYSLNGSEKHDKESTFKISGHYWKIKYYKTVFERLYKVEGNISLTFCSMAGINRANSHSMLRHVSSTSTNNYLHQSVSPSVLSCENQTNATIVETKAVQYETPIRKARINNKSSMSSDLNYPFKSVLEILQARNGTANTLLFKDKRPNNYPTYIFKLNAEENIYQEGKGKNSLAVIVSLVSALLAVGVIILIFLLKEIFSQRQQLRNTRIRLFILYCRKNRFF